MLRLKQTIGFLSAGPAILFFILMMRAAFPAEFDSSFSGTQLVQGEGAELRITARWEDSEDLVISLSNIPAYPGLETVIREEKGRSWHDGEQGFLLQYVITFTATNTGSWDIAPVSLRIRDRGQGLTEYYSTKARTIKAGSGRSYRGLIILILLIITGTVVAVVRIRLRARAREEKERQRQIDGIRLKYRKKILREEKLRFHCDKKEYLQLLIKTYKMFYREISGISPSRRYDRIHKDLLADEEELKFATDRQDEINRWVEELEGIFLD